MADDEAPVTEKAEFIPEDQADDELTEVDGPPKRRESHNSCKVLVGLLAVLLIIGAFFAGYLVRRHSHGTKCKRAPVIRELSGQKHYSEAIDGVSPLNLEKQLRYFSSVPHIAGSNESHQQALYIAHHFKEYGFDKVELKKYSVLLSFPVKPGHASLLDKNGAVLHASASMEKILDPAENDSCVVSPFNAYSPSGNVKGKLVYVNYGHEDDFTDLERLGVNVSGKVVIVRYGKLFRGGKAQNAERRGAKAVIIYSDPADYAVEGTDKTYPDYEGLPKHGVQRGNLWMVKGDPLTPGYPATDGIYRVPKESLPLPGIPVIPISWADATPLLKTLTKTPSPKNWKGGLNISYNIEMDSADQREAQVEVSNKMEQRPVYNVIGTIEGSVEPDRYVIIGSHRDAWVFGAVDPSSGTSCMMETARTLGKLRMRGWKPSRTIKFASWGAEEHGIMGSAEWVEEFEKTLSSRGVVYINLDSAVAGSYTLRARISPIMDTALFKATKKVPSPENPTSETVFDTWLRKRPANDEKKLPKVVPIGAGSDFLFFIQRVGIPCIDLGYKRKAGTYPVYHSVHDTFRWLKTFVDPEFRFHTTVTKVALQLVFDIADSKVLPFDLGRLASALEKYGKNLQKNNQKDLSAQGISLDYVTKGINDFKNESAEFMKSLRKLDSNDPLKLRIANDQLIQIERAFINDEGVPGRPNIRHLIFAPSIFDLYTGSKFAGINDAIFLAKKNNQTKDWEQVKKQISMVVHALRSAVTILKQ